MKEDIQNNIEIGNQAKEIKDNYNKKSKKNEQMVNKKTIIVTIILTVIFTVIMSIIRIIILQNSMRVTLEKPVIYLYPTEEQEITVELGRKDRLTCTYPKYENSWKVLAKPNGDLTDIETGRSLYCLYWEGKSANNDKINEGFCVKKEDTAKFLEEKLAILGLTEREANEFIIYWLPKLEASEYNLINFETMEEIENDMPLKVTPKPETIIRVMMKFKSLNKYTDIKEQKLETTERKGYTVVEWGGTEIK